MNDNTQAKPTPPRIISLRVKNYRALHDLELSPLTPLTVFLGPNGSGKSTIFDVFAFLSECFSVGLRQAWDKRRRFRELRTRAAKGPIVIQLKYREQVNLPLITYHLAIEEDKQGPYVVQEWLQWRRGRHRVRFLDFREGVGRVISAQMPSEQDVPVEEALNSREVVAVNTLGQFTKYPRISALRNFVTSWHLSYLTADSTRGVPEAGAQERLSPTGDNLPNVIQYLREQHPERLEHILEILSLHVPRLEKVETHVTVDGRLLLQIKDAPFERPIFAKFASDGTLKLLAYLTLLYDFSSMQLIGIEEPENYLHPRLLYELAEECRNASGNSQLMVTTHSPFFVNGLRPEEVWTLYRDEKGHTQARRAADMLGIPEFMANGINNDTSRKRPSPPNPLSQYWERGSKEV